MTKRLLVISIAVMSTVLALVALWQFRIVLIYVLISLVLAATFRPISKSESRHNLRTRLLLVLQYIAVLGIAGLLIFFVGQFLVNDVQQLSEALSTQNAWLLPEWLQGTSFQQTLEKWVPPPNELVEQIASQPALVLSAALGITTGLGSVIGGFAVILLLSIYWSINQNHFERLWLSLLPGEVRKHARYISRRIEQDIGAYSRSELLQSVLAILLLGVGYWLLGSPYPALLAVTGAIAWLIPVVGGLLALILPLLLGLLSSTPLGILTVIYTVIVLIALEVWVEPRLFRPKSDNPFLTFVILLAMADAFGLLGIIVAPPLSVICQILWRLLVTDRLAPESMVQVSDLRDRQARLLAAIEEMEGPPPPLVVSSMERLQGLLEKSEPILQRVVPAESPNKPLPS